MQRRLRQRMGRRAGLPALQGERRLAQRRLFDGPGFAVGTGQGLVGARPRAKTATVASTTAVSPAAPFRTGSPFHDQTFLVQPATTRPLKRLQVNCFGGSAVTELPRPGK